MTSAEADSQPYCINDCGVPAIAEVTTGIIMDPDVEDGFWESVELVCADCAGVAA